MTEFFEISNVLYWYGESFNISIDQKIRLKHFTTENLSKTIDT